MKRTALAPQAEHLYVYDQLEYAEIAARLDINERTVRTWSKRGGWADKRTRYLLSKEALKNELIDFTRSLLRDIKTALDAGDDPSRTKVTLLARFGYMLAPPSDFKGTPAQDADDKPQQDPLEAVRQFLGL